MAIWEYSDYLFCDSESKNRRMRDEPYSRGDGPNWVRVWASLLILWAIFLVLGTWFNYHFLFVRGRPISWAASLRMNALAYGIWALVLTPAILCLCAKLPLTRRNWFRLVPTHLLAILGATGADVFIKTLLHEDFSPLNIAYLPFFQRFQEYFLHETEPDIQIYLMVAIIGYVVAYYVDLRCQEWRAAKLQTDLARAELQMLKMQLQPHFLFNTLHSVTALVDTDPTAAKKMICSLGDLLRMSLASEDSPEVTLRQELKFLDRYLDIQRVRFQDRLVTEIRVEHDALEARIPYLLLQPLVENAIKHGVANGPEAAKWKSGFAGNRMMFASSS